MPTSGFLCSLESEPAGAGRSRFILLSPIFVQNVPVPRPRRCGVWDFGSVPAPWAVLLKANKYSLRTNRKWLARRHEPERDRQFRYLARQRRRFQKQGNPAVSIDTKKKEQVGLFKNPGRVWRRAPIDVWDHDFPSLAVGRGIPFGIYDAQRQTGFVVVGTSNETPAFVAKALSMWWAREARWHYPNSAHWFVEADCGGGNNPRVWAWK